MTEIRQLDARDTAAMRALNMLFARVFDDRASYASAPPDEGYLRGFLSEGGHIVLVATSDGVMIGGLVAYELMKFEQARSEIYIYDLAVDEHFRRRGIATALIARLQEIAADRAAWVIFVQADYDDPPAIALYEKLGQREEVLHFDLPVRRAANIAGP